MPCRRRRGTCRGPRGSSHGTPAASSRAADSRSSSWNRSSVPTPIQAGAGPAGPPDGRARRGRAPAPRSAGGPGRTPRRSGSKPASRRTRRGGRGRMLGRAIVEHRVHQDLTGHDRAPVVERPLDQRRGQPATGALPADGEATGVDAEVAGRIGHPPQRRDAVVEGRREGVLGGEAVVNAGDQQARVDWLERSATGPTARVPRRGTHRRGSTAPRRLKAARPSGSNTRTGTVDPSARGTATVRMSTPGTVVGAGARLKSVWTTASRRGPVTENGTQRTGPRRSGATRAISARRRPSPSGCASRPGAVRRRAARSHDEGFPRSDPPTPRRGPPLGRASDLRFRWWRGQDLNLRPSGYEPDELPDCSTPRRAGHPTDRPPSGPTPSRRRRGWGVVRRGGGGGARGEELLGRVVLARAWSVRSWYLARSLSASACVGLVEQGVASWQQLGHLLGDRPVGAWSAWRRAGGVPLAGLPEGGRRVAELGGEGLLQGVADHDVAVEVDDHLLQPGHLGLTGGDVERAAPRARPLSMGTAVRLP